MKRLFALALTALLLFTACRAPSGGVESAAVSPDPAAASAGSEDPSALPSASPAGIEASPSSFGPVTEVPSASGVPEDSSSPSCPPSAAPSAAPSDPPGPSLPSNSPAPASPTPSAPGGYSVSYSGETKDVSGLSAGDRFTWSMYLDSANSSLSAGSWLVDYPEDLVRPVGWSGDGEGSLFMLISEANENGSAVSDIPVFACEPEYEGGSGPSPCGDPGNMYALVIMYLTSFDHSGVQEAGLMISITFEIVSVPAGKEVPVPITVLESTALENGSPAAHGHIEVSPGKLVFGH